MANKIRILVFGLSLGAGIGMIFAQYPTGYVLPDAPPLIHQLPNEQIDKIVDNAADGATIGLPANYAKQLPERRRIGTNELAVAAVNTLPQIFAWTRATIPPTREMTDRQIALLCLSQLNKNIDELLPACRTNTIMYLIGAGISQDLKEGYFEEK